MKYVKNYSEYLLKKNQTLPKLLMDLFASLFFGPSN